ncbi:EpsG family protein [Levilactobacillus enshiensis]|uniref:EpsG family protein n=1 Tax=Levilactobacillus enshiensis TaxID=2590213 RepID=UPI00117AE038|nr:EpsG family protein [Levilactobacillus enshiensis]
MVVEIGIGITAFLVFLGMLFQGRVVFILQIIWLILISGLNTYSVDWENNFGTFQVADSNNLSQSGVFMVVYNFFAVLAKKYGMEYVEFNFILVMISTLLIGFVVFRLTRRPSIVMSLVFIYPFIDNIIQKRWYYALGISVFGIYLSINAKSRTSRTVILLITALIACQFHTGAVLLFTLPVYLLFTEKLQNWITILVVLIGTLGSDRISGIINAVSGGVLADKATLYFTTLAANSSMGHYLFWAAWQVIQTVIIYYVYKYDSENKFVKFVWRLNVWAMCIIPLYMFDPVFTRLFRIVLIFNYVAVANSFWFNKRYEISRAGLFSLPMQILITGISFYVFDINSKLGIDAMIFAIFKNNQFLGLF